MRRRVWGARGSVCHRAICGVLIVTPLFTPLVAAPASADEAPRCVTAAGAVPIDALEARLARQPGSSPEAARTALDLARCHEALGRVDAALAGYRRVDAMPGATAGLRVVARDRLAALEARTYGRVAVECSASDVMVSLGATRWRCPTAIRLRAGQHTLAATRPGGARLAREITLSAGEAIEVEFTFDEPFTARDLLVPSFATFAGGLFVTFGAAYVARDEIADGAPLPDGPAAVGVGGLVVSGIGLATFAGALVWAVVAGDESTPSAQLVPSPTGLVLGGRW